MKYNKGCLIDGNVHGQAFTHMDLTHFNVFEERNTGNFGHLNFITGAGGYLQNVVNGYLGLRYTKRGLDLRPVLPPHGVTSVKLRALSLAGSRVDLLLSPDAVTLTLVEGPGVTIKSQGAPDAALGSGHLSVTVKLCKTCCCGCPGGGCGCLSVVPSPADAKMDGALRAIPGAGAGQPVGRPRPEAVGWWVGAEDSQVGMKSLDQFQWDVYTVVRIGGAGPLVVAPNGSCSCAPTPFNAKLISLAHRRGLKVQAGPDFNVSRGLSRALGPGFGGDARYRAEYLQTVGAAVAACDLDGLE